jgi:hypothetical protein
VNLKADLWSRTISAASQSKVLLLIGSIVRFLNIYDSIVFFFAIDNLYFVNADSDRSNIEVSQLNGENRKILMTTRTETPTSIAVDPITRYIYWADQGQTPTIQRAWLDGTHKQVKNSRKNFL